MAMYLSNKYLVLKTEDIDKLPNTKRILLDEIIGMIKDSRQAVGKPGMNKYYVCNQDEPYAPDVWKTISDGEDNKIQLCECGGSVQPYNINHRWFIRCNECGSLFGDEAVFKGRLCGFETKGQAITAWNALQKHRKGEAR